jgi:hypothetical protein
MIDAEYRPNGEQFAERNETERPVSELVSHSFDAETIETQLYEMLDQQSATAASKGEYFNPSRFIYGYLRRGTTFLSRDEVPEGVSVEAAQTLSGKMAFALGILAYQQWRAEDQMKFRGNLQTVGYIADYCEEAQLQWKQEAYIDWDREWEHDHYIKLPEIGRQLLKCVTNVVGVPYNPQQDTFYFSTVLDQPEPEKQDG